MLKELSICTNIHTLINYTNTSIDDCERMFFDGDIHFYRDETLLTGKNNLKDTVSKRLRKICKKNFFKNDTTWYAQEGLLIYEDKQSQAEFEIGMLTPCFRNEPEQKTTLSEFDQRTIFVTIENVEKWYKKKGRMWVKSPEFQNELQMSLPQETPPSSEEGEEQAVIEKQPVKPKRKREVVSRPQMATYCGVCPATIKNWETGKSPCPEGYPGRSNEKNAIIWGNSHKQSLAMKPEKKALRNAATGHNIDNYSEGYYEN